jgi:hypothetical protein
MSCIAVPDRLLTGDPRYGKAQLILGSLDELDESRLRSVGWHGTAEWQSPRRSPGRPRGIQPPSG